MPKHAGTARIADQALLDQVRACAGEIRVMAESVPRFDALDPEQIVDLLAERARHRNVLLGRALALLEQIGELAQ